MTHRTWLGLAAVLAIAAGCGGGAPTTSTPAPPTVRPALPAGDHALSLFAPAVSVTLPVGWVIAADSADYAALQPAASDITGIYFFRSPQAASQAIDCPIAPAAGVGTSAAELEAWIRERPGLVVGDASAVTIGGLEGLRFDVGILDGWLASCPFADGLPTVPLFVSPTDPGFRWVIAGSERLRLHLLDVPAGGTVVVDIDVFDGSLMDAFLTDASRIVASLSF
ncbi:MAG: hypothetical protein L0227_06310 [Chloroflexi bacterium]|nr:hypothetical protein [Chloroflexota bacterium]